MRTKQRNWLRTLTDKNYAVQCSRPLPTIKPCPKKLASASSAGQFPGAQKVFESGGTPYFVCASTHPTGWAGFDAAERRAFVNHYYCKVFSKILENRGSLESKTGAQQKKSRKIAKTLCVSTGKRLVEGVFRLRRFFFKNSAISAKSRKFRKSATSQKRKRSAAAPAASCLW